MNNTINSLDVKKLHSEGKSSTEIAKILNCTYQTVSRHLKRLGLTKNMELHEAERLRLYNQGLSDGEIAEMTYMSVVGVSSWRYSRGLPANRSKGNHKRRNSLCNI